MTLSKRSKAKLARRRLQRLRQHNHTDKRLHWHCPGCDAARGVLRDAARERVWLGRWRRFCRWLGGVFG
jgi:hypothetical protein